MDEIHEFEHDLKTKLADISILLKESEKSSFSMGLKKEKCELAQNNLFRAKQLYRSIQLVIKTSNSKEVGQFSEKCFNYGKEIEKYQEEIQWKLNAFKSSSAANGVGGIYKNALGEFGAASESQPEIKLENTKQITTFASQVQKDSLKSTERSKNIIQETLTVGREANENLAAQTNQLMAIEEGVDRVDGNVRKAGKQIKTFMKRVATDRIIIGLFVLVILAVIASFVIPTVIKKKD